MKKQTANQPTQPILPTHEELQRMIDAVDLSSVDHCRFGDVKTGEIVLRGAVLSDELRKLAHLLEDRRISSKLLGETILKKALSLKEAAAHSRDLESVIATCQEEMSLLERDVDIIHYETGYFDQRLRTILIDSFPQLLGVSKFCIRNNYIVVFSLNVIQGPTAPTLSPMPKSERFYF